MVLESAANFGSKLAFPDAFYHLKNPDFYGDAYGYEPGESIPLYTMRLQVTEAHLAPNQKNRRLRSVAILFDRKGDALKRPITTLRHVEDDVVVWADRETDERGFVRVELPPTERVAGTWELSFLREPTAWVSKVQTLSGLPAGFSLSDLAAADVAPYDLFRWDDASGSPQAADVNGHPELELGWLDDILIMLEYECLIG
jgi:hypothetical protein